MSSFRRVFRIPTSRMMCLSLTGSGTMIRRKSSMTPFVFDWHYILRKPSSWYKAGTQWGKRIKSGGFVDWLNRKGHLLYKSLSGAWTGFIWKDGHTRYWKDTLKKINSSPFYFFFFFWLSIPCQICHLMFPSSFSGNNCSRAATMCRDCTKHFILFHLILDNPIYKRYY